MKIKLNFELQDGSYDSLIIEGTIEEIRERAIEERNKRGAKDAWSEVLEE